MSSTETIHPVHPRQLSGTPWTRVHPEDDRKHFHVEAFAKKTGEVIMRPVLGGDVLRFPWKELRDRSKWKPGWESTSPKPSG